LQSLPEEHVDVCETILKLLPCKDRARAACLNRAWRVAVCKPNLWQHLDLSFASVGEVTDRALLGAVAEADGQLRSLDISEQKRITRPALYRALEGNAQVTELMVSKLSNEDEVLDDDIKMLKLDDLTALAAAAPNLLTLHASLECQQGEAGQVLRREGVFERVQLHSLKVTGTMTPNDLQGLIQDAALLAANSTLATLILNHNRIGAEGAGELVRALEANSRLTTLSLMGNDIRGGGALALGLMLMMMNSALTTLDLAVNNIGDEGAKDLGLALFTNSTLTTLNLYCNNIRAGGAVWLGRPLARNSTMTTLNLRQNNIGAEGARELGRALAVNSTLTTLDLGYNNIGTEGAQELGRALAANSNSTLTTLSLMGNYIGDGTLELGLMLKKNSTLTTLDVASNRIGDEGARELGRALAENSTLTTLDLCGNDISDDGALALEQALAVNPTLITLKLTANRMREATRHALRERHGDRLQL